MLTGEARSHTRDSVASLVRQHESWCDQAKDLVPEAADNRDYDRMLDDAREAVLARRGPLSVTTGNRCVGMGR